VWCADRTSDGPAPGSTDRASRLQARDSRWVASVLSLGTDRAESEPQRRRGYVQCRRADLGPSKREVPPMGYEDAKADAKETMRNVDNKAKETWRKADGDESLSD
jgi:hypothetical protein